ncbi:AAA family ATPase [Paraburkholderia terricola]|uniref:AAA family ATPase n=1 Tax=Paraburkholderia terricola TaxID=169427 RepID=UPI0035B5030B
MAWRLKHPLITLACNEDMTAADLVGPEGTFWQDGPLTLAVRHGAICYRDEVVEIRQDSMVVIHPLTDTRRPLPLEKKGEAVHAHPDFQLVGPINPERTSSNRRGSGFVRSTSIIRQLSTKRPLWPMKAARRSPCAST